MKLAIVSKDPIVAGVLETAALRRGHQSMTVPASSRLAGSLPFMPTFIILCLTGLDDADDPEIVRARESCPGAGLIITAETIAPAARSGALRAGVVDILQVPYNPYDLLTLMEHWVANQSREVLQQSTCQVFDIAVDLESYLAMKNRTALRLTRLELRLLFCLCEHFPNVAPIDRLLAFGWGHDSDADTSILRTHISHLRGRIREAGGVGVEIASRHAIGYALAEVRE